MLRIALSYSVVAFAASFALAGPAAAASFTVDLTHPMGTFAPLGGDITKPDLSKPYKNSIAVPTFGAQAVYETLPNFETNRGYFGLGRVLLADHHGTHVDSPGHFVNTPGTIEVSAPDKRTLDELKSDELIGPLVFIDIGSRVRAVLDRNGGRPSPDKNVTDFSNSSNAVVTAADIDAIAGKLRTGAWVVANAGWSRFYSNPDMATSPYINGWNFPGFSKAACDRLIEIENARGIRVSGLVMDNIGIDSGENSAGPKGDLVTDSWHCHLRGLQRGWKFVENATNLGQLAEARADSCTLFVGAPRTVAAAGGPARVLALCER
ncbi:MAG: cyclase family protein [Pseudomonadota bacterium]